MIALFVDLMLDVRSRIFIQQEGKMLFLDEEVG